MEKQLRVIPVERSMVPDYAAMEGGLMRFIGRKFDPARGGFVMSPEPVSVASRAEYIHELKAGGLLPADADTASEAGVSFAV